MHSPQRFTSCFVSPLVSTFLCQVSCPCRELPSWRQGKTVECNMRSLPGTCERLCQNDGSNLKAHRGRRGVILASSELRAGECMKSAEQVQGPMSLAEINKKR
ncbi:50S ribosomal protein L19 [Frankliniella fusca]|uniref:50S ribosomal protein L19 n=1 Tax=Frankliniella fusca TaxID=407009 RepID=A0AAE1HG74_9NEOP|nr:50S ribosomal protein L19 [Frankliniella fusca]